MLDRIFALVALGSFVLFISLVIIWVPEIDLIIISSICMAMAAYDFYRMLVLVPRRKAAAEAENNA